MHLKDISIFTLDAQFTREFQCSQAGGCKGLVSHYALYGRERLVYLCWNHAERLAHALDYPLRRRIQLAPRFEGSGDSECVGAP